MFYKNNKVQKSKNIASAKEEEVKNNLSQQMKIAVKEQNLEKINLIQRIENEIEKLFVIKKIYEDSKLLGLFKDDVNRVIKDSHFHLIEMILLKEIELLMLGDLDAIEMLEGLKKRAQKKIDDLNKIALKIHQNSLKNLENASSFVKNIEERQGFKIACLEEIALQNKWIKKSQVIESLKFYGNCEYSEYLKKIIN